MRHVPRLRPHVALHVGLILTLVGFVASIEGGSASRALSASDVATRHRVVESYGRMPLSFEANLGQTDSRVNFISRAPGYNLFLTRTEAVMVMRDPASASNASVLRMQMVGANKQPHVTGAEPLPGIANYFVGDDPTTWRTNVPTYGKVRYRAVYDGVDVVYYGNHRELEYDFIVTRGADPGRIRLRFEGADEIRIDRSGDLVLRAHGQEVRQRRPVVYQVVNGARREVAGKYVLRADGREVGVDVGNYDPSAELVIDPVLVYSTYFGGSGLDVGYGIAVDLAGSAYLTGQTNSLSFPLPGAVQPTPGGNVDAFVARINASGTALDYSTYLGGNNIDIARAIAVDQAGNANVAGETRSSNFPLVNPRQPAFGGGNCAGFPCEDAFVTKLSPTGAAVIYSTYIGGDSADNGYGIAVDSSGNAYVAGRTLSDNFPLITPIQGPAGFDDAFVTKFSASGSAIIYSTRLGGGSIDYAHAIAVDSAGSAYLTGVTASGNFPVVNALIGTHRGGGLDAFVTKIGPSGQGLVYSTFLGGASEDRGFAIAVDLAGNAHVTGRTASTNFPVASALQPNFGGGTYDAFVTKLSASGAALVYSTFLGGTNTDAGHGIAVDAVGGTWVTGQALSTNFPLAQPLQSTFGGSADAFVLNCDAAGVLIYSTYLGGPREAAAPDAGYGIAVDGVGNTYVTGQASSFHFPVVAPLQPSIASVGVSDAFVAKFGSNPLSVEPVRVTLSRDAGNQLRATVVLTNPFNFPLPDLTVTLVRGSTLDRSVFVDALPVPQPIGTINPAQSVAIVATLPFTAGIPGGFSGLVQVDIGFPGGFFSDTKLVVTP